MSRYAGERMVVEGVLADVLAAPEAGVRRAAAHGAARLAAMIGAGPPAEVSRALLAASERIVEAAWGRGWQPADLVRACLREQSVRAERPRDARLVADLVAAEARRYSPATLEARWSAQLDELGARVWWADDDGYLAGLIARETAADPGAPVPPAVALLTAELAPDRASRRILEPVLAGWLEALRRLAALPGIAPVGPPPGQARRGDEGGPGSAGTGSAGTSSAEPRHLHRVRALLAKAESTTFAEEADALTAKAQQLMARYSITAALLADGAHDVRGGIPAGAAARRLGVDEPYEAPKTLLLDAVAVANRCRTVWSRTFGFVTVIGFDPDLDAVELLYTSLLVQATSAMTRAGGRQDVYGSSRTKAFRRSFLVAYAGRIRERLAEAADAAAEEAVSDDHDRARLLPVLAARERDVEAATRRLFPKLVSRSVTCRDAEGVVEGRAAADQAMLHGPRGRLRS